MEALDPELADALGAAIGSARGQSFRVASAQPVAGGCIHKNWLLDGGGERFFVKTHALDGAPMFDAEVDSLAALRAAAVVRVPGVVAQGQTPSQAFLVLEHLALQPVTATHGARLGEALAALHHSEGARYGWHRDNFLGTSPQSNLEADDWGTFFGRERLAPLLARLVAKGYRGAWLAQSERIVEKIGAFFLDYRPAPALVHGDLWSGNVGVLASGEPVLFDPACYRGDRETDLAMSELFGGFPETFYLAYRQAAPLAAGYEGRKTLYNYYHVLNHLALFGRGYLRQTEWMARQLFDALRH